MNKKVTKDKTIAPPKIICIKCGCENQSNFYSTKDEDRKYFGKVPYCKDCIKKFYEKYLMKYKNMNLAVYYTLRKIDVPYIQAAYNGAIENINKKDATIKGEDAIISAYMKGLAFSDRNGWGCSFDDSQGESEIDGLSSYDVYTKVKKNRKVKSSENVNQDDYETIEYDTQYLIDKWGNFDQEDLSKLESTYLDYEEQLGGDIEDASTKTLVKQICYQTLEINEERETKGDTTKLVPVLTNLMDKVGLVTKKDNDKLKNIKVGTTIKDIEYTHPIADKGERYKDVDGIGDMVSAMVGALSRTLGKKNQYVEAFNHVFGKYTDHTHEEQGSGD